MTVRRVMGIETEYGISVPGDPTANPMLLSGHVVNAYASRGGARAAKASWDYEDEAPLRDARGFEMARQYADVEPAHRRGGPHPRQRGAHQRRPPVRRPRPPGVQLAGGHLAPGGRDVGPGGGADHAGGGAPALGGSRRARREPLQEQHRRQGRVVRHARELPDAAGDAVRRHRAAPHPVLRRPPGHVRGRAGRHRPGLHQLGVPDRPALGLLRGRGGPGDDAEATDHQHPRRAARGRRPLPPAARHHRRRQPVRRGQPAQARHDEPGAGDDRGPGHLRGPGGEQAGRDAARRVARPDAADAHRAARRPHR